MNQKQELITIGQTVVNGADQYGILKVDGQGTKLVESTWFYPYKAVYSGSTGSLSFSNDKYYHTGWSVDTNYLWRGVFTVWDTDMNLLHDAQVGFQDSSSLFFSHTNTENKIVCTGINWLYQKALGFNHYQLLLMQLDTLGNKVWEHSYTAKPGLLHLQGNHVIATQSGGFAVGGGGAYATNQKQTFAYILIVDSLGNKLNERYFMNDDFGNYVPDIQQKKSGNFIIAYSEAYEFINGSTVASSRKIIIEELEKSTLKTVWHKEFLSGYNNTLGASRLIPQNDSTYLIAGYYHPDYILYQGTYATRLGYIFAITENGDSLWYRDYANGTDSSEENYLNDIAVTPDGGIVGAGRLQTPKSPYTGGLANHVWLFKTDSIGCLYPGCDTVYLKPKAPITEFKVYPNPAQAGQDLMIELPGGTSASVTLYNSIGQVLFKHDLQFIESRAALDLRGSWRGPLFLLVQTPNGNNYVEKIVFY